MKVQIDSNNYLTGNYAMVGDLENSIEMSNLPNDDMVFYTAYKILSRIIEEKVIVDELVLKHREVQVPVYNEERNPTGETTTQIEDYYEMEPVEKIIEHTEYYYELDTVKKQAIQDEISQPPKPQPPTLPEVVQQVNNIQMALIELYGYV